MSKAKENLEHLIYNSAKNKELNFPLIVAVSGGLDSMGLLRGLVQVFSKEKLIVAHFHHGGGNNEKYRDRAERLVRDFCSQNQLIYETAKSNTPLKSEDECRVARNAFLCQTARKHNSSTLVYAHHLDDWLETQLIKIIRGCSFESLKQNMEWSRQGNIYKWRPWMRVTKAEINDYCQKKRLKFCEDPTNSNQQYLRNWLRNKCLAELEEFRPGAKSNMAFSLIHSVESLKPRRIRHPWDYQKGRLSRLYWESLDSRQRKQCLAFFFYQKKYTFVKRTQIEEIVKQLDKNQNDITLSFKTFEVVVNAEHVCILQKNSF